ncbi:MAG: DUF559 domain-containing protein [Bacteroidales bacterium]
MIDKIKYDIFGIQQERIDSLLSLTESPIEKIFLLLLLRYIESKLDSDEYEEDQYFTGYSIMKDFGIYLERIEIGCEVEINDNIKIKTGDKVEIISIVPKKSKNKPQNRIKKNDSGAFIEIQFLHIIPQYEVQYENKKYRLDFAFKLYEIVNYNMSLIKKICIECDGHEFHNRTGEQITRDNYRSRKLTEDDWTVIRFSGSEIYAENVNSFEKTVKQIFKILNFGSFY